MLDLVIPQRRRDLGGFEVGRVLPFAKRRMVGPFVFFDHMGPVQMAAGTPRSVDVRPHPHIGLATVTFLLAGEITHRDSVGSLQDIRPGEVNWMIAGRGITHSERFERLRREGGPVHGLQAWVALPREHEECEPSFRHHGDAELPTFGERGVRGRLLAGSAFGLRSGVQVLSPLFYVHWELAPGTRVALPGEHAERAAYVAAGAVDADGQRVEAGSMAVFAPGEPAELRAETPAVVLALGGAPIGARFIEWNFVSSSRERIEQAKADWRAGRMKLPDGDSDEFVPLPGDAPAPPAGAMS